MRRQRGQSIVETALILPVLLIVVFGIVDFGYYVYAYSTLYQSARTGADKARKIPPMPNRVLPQAGTTDRSDLCVSNIMTEVQSDATLFPDLTTSAGNVQIVYPKAVGDGPNYNPPLPYRRVGEPIEVRVSYRLRPLTPLFQMLRFGGGDGSFVINVTARRSIEALGENPNTENLTACR